MDYYYPWIFSYVYLDSEFSKQIVTYPCDCNGTSKVGYI